MRAAEKYDILSGILIKYFLMYNYKILSNMKKVNDVAVEVLCGDITKITTAALVVPEFCNKIADTALTRRLVYCGAEGGLKSFEAYSKKTRLKPGCVVTTPGGGNAKYLFHSAMEPGDKETYLLQLKTAVANILVKALEFKLTTLAVPDFRLGGNCPLSQAEMVEAMLSVLNGCPQKGVVEEFTIVLSEGGKEYEKAVDVLESESYVCPASV